MSRPPLLLTPLPPGNPHPPPQPATSYTQPQQQEPSFRDSFSRESSLTREPSSCFTIEREMSGGLSFLHSTSGVGLMVDPSRFMDLARGLWLVMQEMVDEEIGNASGEWSSVMLPSQRILQEGLKNVYVRTMGRWSVHTRRMTASLYVCARFCAWWWLGSGVGQAGVSKPARAQPFLQREGHTRTVPGNWGPS